MTTPLTTPLDLPPPQTQVGFGPNGLGVDNQGRLIVAEHTLRQVARREPNGTKTILASHFEGKRLNSPNDFVVRRSDGSIYFTDPGYGIDRTPGATGVEIDRQLDFQGIYRIAPNGSLHLVADNANRPNGLALSVDEKIMYVNDSANPPRPPRASVRCPARWVAHQPSHLRRHEQLAGGRSGRQQGGRRGNLWVAGLQEDPGGAIRIGNVLVYDPSGRLLGKILLPERALNVGFGGADWKTLYITATTSVYRVKTKYGGIPHPTTRSQGTPAISATGIVNASARGAAISPGSIVEIYGSNLAIASCSGRTTLADTAFLQPNAREDGWAGGRAALCVTVANQRAGTVGSRSRSHDAHGDAGDGAKQYDYIHGRALRRERTPVTSERASLLALSLNALCGRSRVSSGSSTRELDLVSCYCAFEILVTTLRVFDNKKRSYPRRLRHLNVRAETGPYPYWQLIRIGVLRWHLCRRPDEQG